ncbi:uncharacterized protein LOC127834058 [Dreissena polymorpha]|nr:uncharacterized protein LOC127834058 [Dreissena polymorpha]XP_052215588.1 uncharacterized protein LOC127834058 [Dreissena polymorpha]
MDLKAVCMLLLLTTVKEARGQTNAGLKLTVTKEILDKVNAMELQRLQTLLTTVKLDDAYDDGGDFSWRISGIQISSAGTLSSSVQLRTGSFSWSLQISSLEINANWKMKYDPGRWLPTVRDSGRLSTSVRQSGITLTVQPVVETESLQVNLQDCSASLSGLEVSFGGSILSRFYELVANAFEGDIRRQLERAICKSITRSMGDVRKTLTDVQTTSNVHVFNTDFTVDYGVAAVEVTSDHIATFHKGTVIFAGQTFPVHVTPFIQAMPTSGVSFDLAEEFFNNVLTTALKNNFSDAFADYAKVKRKNLKFMYLTCDNAFCLGRLLPQAKDRWPERVVGVRVYVSDSNLSLDTLGATLNIRGRFNFSAESATEADPMFSAIFDFALPVQVKFFNGFISAKLANASGQIVIDQSHIGKILIPGLRNLFDVMTPNFTRLGVETLNSSPVSTELKLPKDVMFQTSSVQLFPKKLRVNADLCQKGTSGCSYSAKDEWVGRSDGGAISVVDTITTTTSTTTTTTTIQTPTTTITTTTIRQTAITTTTTTPRTSTTQKQTEAPTTKPATKSTEPTSKPVTVKPPEPSTENAQATNYAPMSSPIITTSINKHDQTPDTVLRYNGTHNTNNSTRRLIVDLSIGKKSANSPLTSTKNPAKTNGARAMNMALLLLLVCIVLSKFKNFI